MSGNGEQVHIGPICTFFLRFLLPMYLHELYGERNDFYVIRFGALLFSGFNVDDFLFFYLKLH